MVKDSQPVVYWDTSAIISLETGPWRRVHISPIWDELSELCMKWPLRGADLWHLATAKRIRKELPELFMITFDERLNTAAQGLGLTYQQ